MSDELEQEHPGDATVNADAIVEAFSDDHHIEDDDEDGYGRVHDDDEDDDGDFMDTNTEIMNHDNHW